MSYDITFVDPVFPPEEEVLEDYRRIHKNNYYTNNGPIYFEFKESIESYIANDVKVSVVANATLGLIASIQLLMNKEKKYVIVPSYTFAAGPLSIRWAGFEPYFIDINLKNLQPNIDQAREVIENSNEIAGVLFCSTFGIADDEISQWESLCSDNGLPLVIDSAAGFGSKYQDGEVLGARGDCEIFSLHATKPFGIGEGGIVSSSNHDLIEKIEEYKNFGFGPNRSSKSLGLNAKISELSCAIGLRMLGVLDARLKIRREIFGTYYNSLKEIDDIDFVLNAENSSLCFANFILPDRINLQDLMNAYYEAGIEVRDYYNPPVHTQEYFLDSPKLVLTNTIYIASRNISIPNSDKLTSQEINRILEVIKKYV